MSTLRTTLVAVFTLGLIATASPAQTPSPCGVVAQGLIIYGPFPKTGAPFSATIKTTREQKFVDGNAIHGQIVTHYYRDSAGHIRAEMSTGCDIGADGQFRPLINISVNDPVARTSTSWTVNDTGEKVARFYHQPAPQPAPAAPPLTEEQRKLIAMAQDRSTRNDHSEKLGTRIIAGVLCDGTRSVHIVPAGDKGNEQPIEISTEFWTTRDSRIVMLNIQDDPYTGRNTTEVTEFSLAEPDPSLFAPPPDYKLVEQFNTTVPASAVK
jgi:hypothetical protein